MKTRIILAIALLMTMINATSLAQLIIPFTQRTSPLNPGITIYNLRGDFTMAGNTNLSLQNYSDNTGNSNTMVYVDVDNDPTTLNSSSSNLVFASENGSIPECSEVVYAGLYWTGRSHDGTNSPNTFSVTKNGVTVNYDKQIVKIKGPTASGYTNITATSSDIYYPQGSDGFMYSAYAEITDYVQNNGVQGVYTVADIALSEGFGGSTGFYGGWGMVVIYGNNSMNLRDITVFDGHAYVAGGITADFTIPVSGFNSNQSGPVNVKMGMIAGEGDRNIAGDFFQIRNAANTAWVDLVHGGNTAANFFNSSIFTGSNQRNPNLLNNTGLDICTFDIPNQGNTVIANNQTSTTFRYGTTQDTYVIFAMVFGVGAYEPEIVGVNNLTSINNGPVSSPPIALPGEELTYQLDILNTGNENIVNGQVIIPIPYNATFNNVQGQFFFTPNSGAVPYFDPLLGSNGSIVWNVGDLPLPVNSTTVLAELVYTLNATEDCLILANSTCESSLEVNGNITGMGGQTNITLSEGFISGYQQSNLCTGTPITTPVSVRIDGAQFVAENCSEIETSYSFVFCGLDSSLLTLPTTQISGSFPIGTRFFDSNPVTTTSIEYTSSGFPIVFGTETYYAYPEGIDAPCFIELTITMIDSALTTVPLVQDYTYCLNDSAQPIVSSPSQPNNFVNYYISYPGLANGQIIPNTNVSGITTFYAVEGISNNCLSSNAAPINVTVLNNSASSLSGINGTSSYSTSATVNNEICFDVFSSNVDTNQTVSISYNNAVAGAIFITDSNSFPTGTFCWTPSANNIGTNQFELTVTSECGESQTFTYEILVESEPCDVQVSLESFGNLLCSSNDGSAIVSAIGGTAPYVFTLINTSSGEIFTNNTGVFANLTEGDYSVVVSDSNNCQPVCTNLDFSITGEVSSITSEIITSDLLCASSINEGSITINATGGTPSYLYSVGGNFVSNNTFNGLEAGIYDVTVMDVNGCSITETVTIESPEILTALLDNVQQALCGQNNGSINVSVNGGVAPYQITLNGSVVSPGLVSNLTPGSYTLLVTDANNCTATGTVEVTSPPALSASLTDLVQPNCVNISGSFNVSVSGGTSPYEFSNGNLSQSTGVFVNQTPGQYNILITDASGCTTSIPVSLNEPTPLISEITDLLTPSCGTNTGSFGVNISSGTSPFTYIINGVSSSAGNFVGLSSGNYEVIVLDANQCIDSLIVNLEGTPSFTLSSNQQNVSCFGACDGSIAVSGSAQSLQYEWSSGASGSTLNDLCAGNYSVTATDVNGCQQSLTIIIEEPLPVSLYVSNIIDADCNQSNGSATLSASGGTSPYTYSIAGSSLSNVVSNNNGLFNGLSSGGYAYYVADANGCGQECIELFFVNDDCAGTAGRFLNENQNETNKPYLITSYDKSLNQHVFNYSTSSESEGILCLVDDFGNELLTKSLLTNQGFLNIKDAELPSKTKFVVLKDQSGKIYSTARIKK
jgi:hypothetical protein